MALVKFGAGVSEIRGKEGGVIYSRNAYGAYIKSKVSPVNPQSVRQQEERSLMGNLALLWSILTIGQQAAWDNLGAQLTRVNRFGDSTTYTGFSLFMRLNRNLSICGIAAKTEAPSIPTMSNLVLSAVDADVSDASIDLTFTPTPVPAATHLVIYSTPNILTARRFVKNFYRLIASYAAAAASPLSIYTDWNATFGTPLVAGAHLFLKCKLIDDATGFDTVPAVISTTVVA